MPQNIHEVQSFLGLANYYRKFITGFCQIAAPLHHLTSKKVQFKWTAECDTAFQTLKQALVSIPILAYQEFQIYVDTSDSKIGMLLHQIQNGNEVVIAYAGRGFNPAENN